MGDAFDAVEQADAQASVLLGFALAIVGISLLRGVMQLFANYMAEIVALRIERDVRDELYVNLLGKSQTYHGQQRIGDIMARATNDVRQLNYMVNPGLLLLSEWLVNMVAPIVAHRPSRAYSTLAHSDTIPPSLSHCLAWVLATAHPGCRRAAGAVWRDERYTHRVDCRH